MKFAAQIARDARALLCSAGLSIGALANFFDPWIVVSVSSGVALGAIMQAIQNRTIGSSLC